MQGTSQHLRGISAAMFERYTETARRVIFFARYEASQFGAQAIEPEHILLGILREDPAQVARFVADAHRLTESIRKEIEARTALGEKTSTSVDIPLSGLAKRVLAFAAEEAERLSSRWIGPEHLLLGLLRVETSMASEILRERGLRLNGVRADIEAGTPQAGGPPTYRWEREVYHLLAEATVRVRRALEHAPHEEFEPGQTAVRNGVRPVDYPLGIPATGQTALKGRVALVTGAGRGIGRAVALALAAAGAGVALVARSRDEIERVAAEILEGGGVATAIPADVSRSEDVKNAFEAAREALGPVEILVNNAGVARSALTWKTDDELWRSTIETNLNGTFYCMREALPSMLEQGWGRVVNVASVAGKVGAPYISAYTASKHGVVGLTRSAALEVATRGVTVNAICPGYVDTPMTDGSVATIVEKTSMSPEQARKRLEQLSPQNRVMEPEEVAYLVLVLTSDLARGINGQAINLDGGGVTG
jgi:NAD(P)-dependent dehydrogenase (short-subunit alcohol dehydrogenase family)